MTRTSLTIVTISYGNYDELIETINSVALQKNLLISPVEVILVLNGYSSDQIKKIKSICKDIPKVIYRIGEDKSLYNAMNIGLEKCRNSHVLFLNSGDKLNSINCIEIILNRIVLNEISVFQCIQYFENENYLRPNSTDLANARKISHQAFVAPTTTSIFFNEKILISADSDWMQKKLKMHKFNYCEKPITKFKLGGVSNKHSIQSALNQILNKQYIKAGFEILKYMSLIIFTDNMRYRIKAKINNFERLK
ncbi:glycosyltransferase [Amylibacter sp.]|nr:glycosyltransferase [Amylibacter sp.]